MRTRHANLIHYYMPKILTEITPLTNADCFYVVDRRKKEFDFPVHRHLEYEINFIKGCKGARRVVGDSLEVLGDFDLAIIGPGLEHAWEQHECDFEDKREITIQFNPSLLPPNFLTVPPCTPYATSSSRPVRVWLSALMQSCRSIRISTR